MTAYKSLVSQLQQFITKYYKNILLKGVIVFFILTLLLLLLIIFSESIAYFSVSIRTFLFYLFLLSSIGVFVYFILIPFLKILKFGKLITFEQSSKIISDFFPEIQDKLLNTLELYKKNMQLSSPDALIIAGIEQKSLSIAPFKFSNAVNFKDNFKYFKYLLLLLLLFTVFYAISGSTLFQSVNRVINHDVYYEKPAPFKFLLVNDTLNIEKGSDVTISALIEGNIIPAEVVINFSGNIFAMQRDKQNKSLFTHEIKNLNNNLQFNFSAQNISSKQFEIKVLPSPVLLNFTVNVDYPNYTGIKDNTFSDVGDFTVPQGTKLSWVFNTKNTDSLKFITKKENILLANNDNFYFTKTAIRNFSYILSVSNQYFFNKKLIEYNIAVVPDLYPSIYVNSVKDTSNYFLNYFKGRILDDYGFKNLTFHYRIVEPNFSTEDNSVKFEIINLPFNKNSLKEDFYFSYDFSFLNEQNGKIAQFFFQVSDNDGFNGSKKSKTQISSFEIPDIQALSKIEETANQNVMNKMDLSIQLANEIQSDLQKLREMNLNNNMSEWENTQLLQEISTKQQLLENLIKETNEENKAKNKFHNTFKKEEEELLKKQMEIQKLMDEVFSEEMKELMKKINELQKKYDKKQMQELLKNNEMTNEQLAKQLERNKELLKRYEVEENVENTAEELKKLADKQKELSELTKNKKFDKDSLKNMQKSLKEEFQKLKDKYEKTLEKNKELETPMKLDEFSEEMKNIEDELDNSEEKLDQNKKSKASESQSKNSKNMQKLAEDMQSMMSGGGSSQQGEDEQLLKKMVNNLLLFSFDQEQLINDFKNISPRDPKYVELTKKQLILKDNFKTINDSLFALAKRQSAISSPIMKQLDLINSNLQSSITLFEAKKYKIATKQQNIVMMAVNNLALLLDQVLNNMQNQQGGGSGKGQQKSKKPDGSQKSLEQMKKGQESLKKQMEDMLKQMQNGEGQFDQNAMNKKLAQMLAQQEIYKQMMQEMQARESLSPETQRILNEIKQLSELNEKDLVNKRITPALIERQKKITSRLLEAQNAENKRKTDNKRESKQGETKTYKSAEDYFNKYKKNSVYKEDLYNKSIRLKQFYKKLNTNYSDKINK